MSEVSVTTSGWFAPRLTPPAEAPAPEETDVSPPEPDVVPEPGPVLGPEPEPAASPPVEPEPQPEPEPPVAPYAGDPERGLSALRLPLDPDTLRERVEDPTELRSIRAALTERLSAATDPATRARLLGLRAVTHRLLGDLDAALTDAHTAVDRATETDQLRRTALARARLARVHQWRGEFELADELYTKANSTELPAPLRASLFTHLARSAFDQGRLLDACAYLERTLQHRRDTFDAELIAEVELTLDAIAAVAERDGFGPSPLEPTFTEQLVPEGDYADAQPYVDGLAWIRRTETSLWEAIDADAAVVIDSGYDDVRPFRYGVAAVKRAGGWGAVDRSGKVVLSCSYDQFCTALADGRYVEGFTEEGLAIVERAGLKGVVDRTGKVLLPTEYRGLVLHPVAYLIVSAEHQWGALDRRGEEIVAPVFASRAEVIEFVERLMSDARVVI